MANHLREQNAYSTCKLLLDEIERVVGEELRLREKLMKSGVRDVTGLINLPRNRLDQLDAESADYDDKRLCHACKHVCFFAAVACECSQSKVSCLRHSHYMCRCAMERKYFMIWSDEDELKSTLQRVRDHCSSLKKLEAASSLYKEDSEKKAAAEDETPPTGLSPGVEKDLENHKDDEINLDPVMADEQHMVRHEDLDLTGGKTMRCKSFMGGPAGPPAQQRAAPAPAVAAAPMIRRVSHDTGTASDEDEVQVVAVFGVKPEPPELPRNAAM